MMKKQIITLIFLFSTIAMNAQQFIGGRLNRDRVLPNGYLTVDIQTYTLGAPVPAIEINWGNGEIEEVLADTNAEVDAGLFWNHYDFYHVYETPGDYTISYVDSFWVDDIINLINSGERYFRLEEKVTFSDTSLLNRPVAIRSPFPFNYSVLEDGSITLAVNYLEFELDSVTLRFRSFPEDGYTIPPATDTLICCIEWRNPPESGRYLFAMEAAEFRNGEEISTNSLFIALDVPSISNLSIDDTRNTVRVYPNPTHQALYLESNCSGQGNGFILNTQGQVVQSFVQEPMQGSRMKVEITQLPPGMYWLRWVTEECDVVERFVKY